MPSYRLLSSPAACALALLVCAFVTPACAQSTSIARETVECEGEPLDGWVTVCESRTDTFDAPEAVSIDAGRSGSITVVGVEGDEVRVRSQIRAYGRDQADAEAVAASIRVTGPEAIATESDGYASISFLVEVPTQTDLTLATRNGSIGIEDVAGRIRFETRNGAVRLARLDGDVVGSTSNGPIVVTLSDRRPWTGTGLDAQTKNGDVQVVMPTDHPYAPSLALRWQPERRLGTDAPATAPSEGQWLDIAVPTRVRLDVIVGDDHSDVESVTSDFAMVVPRGQDAVLNADVGWGRLVTGRYPAPLDIPKREVSVGPTDDPTGTSPIRLQTKNGMATVVWDDAR